MCLATVSYMYVYATCAGCVTIFSTGGKFRPVWSYTLLLQPPIVILNNQCLDNMQSHSLHRTGCILASFPRLRVREGSPIETTSLRPFSAPSTGVTNVCEAKNIPHLVQNKEHVRQTCYFDGGPPPLSTQVDTDVIHMIKQTRTSPNIVRQCKRSKTRWWEGLGMHTPQSMTGLPLHINYAHSNSHYLRHVTSSQ